MNTQESEFAALKIVLEVKASRLENKPLTVGHIAAIIDAEFAGMRKERDAIKSAASAFVTRLQEIHDHPKHAAAWLSYQNHYGYYNGPQYGKELISLKEALAQASEKKV